MLKPTTLPPDIFLNLARTSRHPLQPLFGPLPDIIEGRRRLKGACTQSWHSESKPRVSLARLSNALPQVVILPFAPSHPHLLSYPPPLRVRASKSFFVFCCLSDSRPDSQDQFRGLKVCLQPSLSPSSIPHRDVHLSCLPTAVSHLW